MKIDATSSLYAIENYRRVSKTVVPDSVKPQKDDIELSDTAVSFAEVFNLAKENLQKQIDGSDPRVEAIKHQIANGTYSVDADEVAASILFFA